jgi:phospholipid N-methyltransferase
MADGFVLFREFLRSPTAVATVTASSDSLIEEMLRPFPTTDDPVVVELGAGSGRMTGAVRRRLAGRGRHVAIEINPVLAERLATRYPEIEVVCADACALPEVLAARGVPPAHLVASLLPWQAYAKGPISRYVADVLAPGGVFTQAALSMFLWMEPARRQDRQLRLDFPDVRMSPTVWRNLPPARVRVARSAAAA